MSLQVTAWHCLAMAELAMFSNLSINQTIKTNFVRTRSLVVVKSMNLSIEPAIVWRALPTGVRQEMIDSIGKYISEA